MSARVILITGANGGLGQAIARSFLDESPANVVCLAVRSGRDRADQLAAEFPGRAQCVQLDVRKPDSWKPAVESILSKHQRLDVLVNNAGTHQDGLLATLPLDAWEEVLRIHLDGVF